MANSNRSETRGRTSSLLETSKNRTLYEILGIQNNATEDDIKRAYRQLALKYHPDKVSEHDRVTAKEKFQEVNNANKILSNPTKRKIYDNYGDLGIKMMDQFGGDEEKLKMLVKPWVFWLFCAIGLFTCGFCLCCCCFCCCFNFCCGKCKPNVEEQEYYFESRTQEENVSVSQPENAHSSPFKTHTVIVMGVEEHNDQSTPSVSPLNYGSIS